MPIQQPSLQEDVQAFLDARQKALNIVKTTTTPSGQTLDWVPLDSQIPSGKIASPPAASPEETLALDAARPVKAVTFELDDPAVERGPAGTVPILRPTAAHIAALLSSKTATKVGGIRLNRLRPNVKPTDPNPFGYYHSSCGEDVNCYGCDLYINMWDPSINNPAGPGDDHSILQIWLQNYDKPELQSIEGGWTVDRNLDGDTQPHVFTYYTTNGYTQDGNDLGGYNRTVNGWVQYSNSVFPGIRINGTSTYGGTQYEISMKFQLYKEPTNGQLNWWVSVQGIWMGYYPASLFNGGIGNKAEWLGMGGEVYSSLANPAGTHDQMGSGHHANDGWTRAAFLRNMRYQNNLNGAMSNYDGAPEDDTATGTGTSPYTIDAHMNSGSSWASYCYLGGPSN